jgi:UDP-N-acetylmuramate--alanine ligase
MVNEAEILKTDEQILTCLNKFPGVGRRFERIADGVYTDYAHHPEEIEATIEIANEESERLGKKGVVAIYEPHQNTRQHEVKDGYKNVFEKAKKVFWLPTYFTREDTSLAVLTPEDFIKDLVDPGIAEAAEPNEDLEKRLKNLVKDGYLILLMTAGPADSWLRKIML